MDQDNIGFFTSLKMLLGRLIKRNVHYSKMYIGKTLSMEDNKEFQIFRDIIVDTGNHSEKTAVVFKVRFKFANLPLAINKRLSMFPTPFLIAKPGFREKIWTVSEDGWFQGIYQWFSEECAKTYPRSTIFKMMTKRSAEGTLSYEILPNTILSEYIEQLIVKNIMKTLIIGAGPLGTLYTHLFHKAGHDITILARNEHYDFVKENGIVLVNEFTGEKTINKVKVVDSLGEEDFYDLVIVIMRKNSVRKVLPVLSKNKKIQNILFMGNNTQGFDEYLNHLPEEKILFGFPGGGGSRIDHVVHYVDTDKPNGKRLKVTLGEIDGQVKERTQQIKQLFESSKVPASIVDDIDSWLKYHVVFVNPIAGALYKSGDNYNLAKDRDTIRTYIRAVKEGGRVLKKLGYKKSYNPKLKLFYIFPEGLLISILKKVFNSKFAEIAMMMHANAARDEMEELGNELKTLIDQTAIKTPNLDELIGSISVK